MQAACSFLKPGAARAGRSRPSRQFRDFYQSAGIQASAFLLIPLSASVRKQDRFKAGGKVKKQNHRRSPGRRIEVCEILPDLKRFVKQNGPVRGPSFVIFVCTIGIERLLSVRRQRDDEHIAGFIIVEFFQVDQQELRFFSRNFKDKLIRCGLAFRQLEFFRHDRLIIEID